MLVVLDEADLDQLRMLARAIEMSKCHLPSPDWGVDSEESRFLSLCAERCVAQVLGCVHDPQVLPGGDGHIDLWLPRPTEYGQTLEVKFRRERYRDLATTGLRFWEELQADLYVLVWPSRDGVWQPGDGFEIVGFATKQDFHQRIISRPPVRWRGEKWEIRWQDLRAFGELFSVVKGDSDAYRTRRIVCRGEPQVRRDDRCSLRAGARVVPICGALGFARDGCSRSS